MKKKAVLIGLFFIILAIVLLPQLSAEETIKPKTPMIQWWWLLVVIAFAMGYLVSQMAKSVAQANLEDEVDRLETKLENKEKVIETIEKLLEGVQQKRERELKEKYAHITAENVWEYLDDTGIDSEFMKLYKKIAKESPDSMLEEIGYDKAAEYWEFDKGVADTIEEQIADNILKRR